MKLQQLAAYYSPDILSGAQTTVVVPDKTWTVLARAFETTTGIVISSEAAAFCFQRGGRVEEMEYAGNANSKEIMDGMPMVVFYKTSTYKKHLLKSDRIN